MNIADKNRFARPVAEILLETGAVTINTTEWYVYSSGIVSPIYCDMRWMISFPKERNEILHCLMSKLEDEIHQECIDVLAGVATAGIPYAAWLSDRLGKPLIYVRESSKPHGKRQQIEGRLVTGQRVLVIEDLFTTGRSAIETVYALRRSGAVVSHCLAIFDYALPYAHKAFEHADVCPVYLCSIKDLLLFAQVSGRLSENDRKTVETWLASYSERIGTS